jgi:hypothetical protein
MQAIYPGNVAGQGRKAALGHRLINSEFRLNAAKPLTGVIVFYETIRLASQGD